MIYAEVEQRRHMLQALYEMIEENTEPLLHLTHQDVAQLGSVVGLSQSQADRLFIRLLEAGFIRAVRQCNGRLFYGADQRPFLGAVVEDLTDKGLREIAVLPPENSYEALVTGLERYITQLERDPAMSEEQKQRQVSKWRALLGTLREVGVDFGAKVAGEVIKGTMGL
ncbi:MAG TPA: hypothetical protein VFL91_06970 [Thermomicrobiales bacterium]|nr:hypothetical protein [Thermomicrobiales bacterium]